MGAIWIEAKWHWKTIAACCCLNATKGNRFWIGLWPVVFSVITTHGLKSQDWLKSIGWEILDYNDNAQILSNKAIRTSDKSLMMCMPYFLMVPNFYPIDQSTPLLSDFLFYTVQLLIVQIQIEFGVKVATFGKWFPINCTKS